MGKGEYLVGWKCSLIPKGQKCPYEEFEPMICIRHNLAAAVQELRWSLPLVGKRYKTYESRIKCDGWKK